MTEIAYVGPDTSKIDAIQIKAHYEPYREYETTFQPSPLLMGFLHRPPFPILYIPLSTLPLL